MSNLSELVERARYCREHGNFDGLHGELLDMVEFLEHEFEAERDRANEHFEARTDAEAKLRQVLTLLDQRLMDPHLHAELLTAATTIT